MYIASQLLIATLTTTPAVDGVRDLCDVVHRKTGTPTICKPHKEGAPIYNANVCCSRSMCFPTSRGRCQSGESLYYCGLGEQNPAGAVDCYFEVSEYCDVFPSTPMISPPPMENSICCHDGLCWPDTGPADCEVTDIYFCYSGMSNADGTITCLDEAD